MKTWLEDKVLLVETVLFYGTLIPAGIVVSASVVSSVVAIGISLKAMDLCGESISKFNRLVFRD